MKVTLIASMYAPGVGGGAERVVQSQAEALAARGHVVHVLTLGNPASGTHSSILNGVHVVRIGIDNFYLPGSGDPAPWARASWHARDVYNTAMARMAREQLSMLRPDIVVCHNIYGWSSAVWPSIKSLGLPLIQVLHDYYFRCIRSSMFRTDRCVTACALCTLMRFPHKRLSRLPDAVVGVSRYIVDNLTEAGYFAKVPVRTHIHNACHFDTRLRAMPPLSGPEVVFGFIGSLHRIKGIESLLSAFRTAAQPSWRLLIAGTGDSTYVERLRAANTDRRIEFLGRQDPTTFYDRIDATVVPSLWDEALGNVVFESLVHGRPVIGSVRGGIREMLEDGTSGLLFDPADHNALEKALTVFSSSVEQWRARQAAIKATAAPRYCDREAWVARWESLFRVVLAGDRRSSVSS